MSAVYKAVSAVMKELSQDGISKGRKNQAQGYAFRGIDDVYNALSSVMSRHGLMMLPRVLARTCDERVNGKGTALFYVTVDVEFDLVSADDGSRHTIRTFGEAMDSGDKATNKAMSAAYKYAAMQAFCIPTEGDNDADAHTHDVAPVKTPQQIAAGEFITLCKTSTEPAELTAAFTGLAGKGLSDEQIEKCRPFFDKAIAIAMAE